MLGMQLKAAHIKDKPEDFVRKTLNSSLMLSAGLGVAFFFFFSKMINPFLTLLPIPIIFLVVFFININRPLVMIRKRQRELDREVLFAGRYLQVKLQSGKPLLNALTEAAGSYGVAGKYFKEIVDDINIGTPIEKALENAMKYSPSQRFKKILFQVNNALKIGINVGDSLTNVLDEIATEQLLDIKEYSEKLSSLSLFYMMGAIVLPSLGTAMLAVIGSLIGFLTDNESAKYIFALICVFLIVLQGIFMMVFKSIRLSVHI